MSKRKGFVVICKAENLMSLIEGRLAEEGFLFCGNDEGFEREVKISVCDFCHDDITTSHECYSIDGGLIHGDCLYGYMDRYKV